MNLLNEKGQAALVDSIIFLTIVSTIVTMLLFFMVDYGDRVNVQLDSLYAEDFSIDTLKVITYINVLRDGRSVFEYDEDEENSPEYDYLLARMKEDYADTQSFSLNTKKAISNTVADTLRPFEKSIDYVLATTKDHLNEWVTVKTNVKDHFKKFHNLDLDKINGLAIMADTDNSKLSSVAYFQDIYFSSE